MNSAIKIRRSHLQGLCAALALVLAITVHPYLALIPTGLHTFFFLPKAFQSFKRLSSRNRLAATLTAFGLLSLVVSVPAQAIQFSFLLASTQTAMESCIFNQITGLAILSGIIFMAIRGSTMLGLTYVAFEAWQEKRKQQDASEQIKTLVYALVAILVVGVLEPLIIGGGCAANA